MDRWTETAWLQCDNLALVMHGGLKALSEQSVTPLSDRKLRHLMVANVESILRRYDNTPTREVIQTMERFAEGRMTCAKLEKVLVAHAEDCTAFDVFGFPWSSADLREMSHRAVESSFHWVLHVFSPSSGLANMHKEKRDDPRLQSAQKMLIAILRDVLGNPFREPLDLSPAVIGWNDGALRKLAQTIYDERAFNRMPVLADALEDASCNNADILNHCRQPGEHVRGCWVVDLLLGKE
jgi:hypothetical protein